MMHPIKKFDKRFNIDPEFRVWTTVYATAAITTVAGVAAAVYGTVKIVEHVNN